MNLNKPTECVQSSNQECVGTQWTNYVYKLTESKLIVAKNNSVVSQLLKMSVFLCREENLCFHCLSVSLHFERFPFNEQFWFEFLKISSDEWSSIFRISGNEDNPARYIKILENHVPRILLHLTFPAAFSVENFTFR